MAALSVESNEALPRPALALRFRAMLEAGWHLPNQWESLNRDCTSGALQRRRPLSSPRESCPQGRHQATAAAKAVNRSPGSG
jgi:hypothetical protein